MKLDVYNVYGNPKRARPSPVKPCPVIGPCDLPMTFPCSIS